VRFAFLTATPLDIIRGSGTFSGISTLARALTSLECEVTYFAPRLDWPIYTFERLWFNEQLRYRDFSRFDAVIGFDMDGYRIVNRTGKPHVASIKGVIADELRFERGFTRRSMAMQAACERRHVRRADLVVTTTRYAASRIETLYELKDTPAILPEPIDLEGWHELFARNPFVPDAHRFTVLCVCRFFPRKRVSLLLEAAARLRATIPELEVRIVGGGPEARRLRRIWRERHLEDTVTWLGDISQYELAHEYQRCHVFCLPSVQEGFGIVFLEAMAAGKPIIATRAAAVPEVAPFAVLAEPDDTESLAEAIRRLHASAELRDACTERGREWVRQYNSPRVAKSFLELVSSILRLSPA
jgi:glycosyltransferase involved in cell wall biosynthesis